jgi:hypothetical protein
MLQAVDQFTEGATAIMHQIALLYKKIKTLRKANKGLSKYRRAKKTRVRLGGTLMVQDTEDILDQRDVDKQVAQETRQGSCFVRGTRTKIQCYRVCGKPSYNTRTCQAAAESIDSTASDTIEAKY